MGVTPKNPTSNKIIKLIWEQAIWKFNHEKPENGVKHLLDAGLLRHDPAHVAKFIFMAGESLSRSEIAKYISGSDEFHMMVLKEYMNLIAIATGFSGIYIDDAIRRMLLFTELPSESQQINRVAQALGSAYCQCNPTVVSGDEEAAFSLAASVLMLNTDLHNSNIKKKMSEDRWLHIFRNKPEIDKEYLRVMYKRIKKNEIVLPKLQNQHSGSQSGPPHSPSVSAHIDPYPTSPVEDDPDDHQQEEDSPIGSLRKSIEAMKPHTWVDDFNNDRPVNKYLFRKSMKKPSTPTTPGGAAMVARGWSRQHSLSDVPDDLDSNNKDDASGYKNSPTGRGMELYEDLRASKRTAVSIRFSSIGDHSNNNNNNTNTNTNDELDRSKRSSDTVEEAVVTSTGATSPPSPSPLSPTSPPPTPQPIQRASSANAISPTGHKTNKPLGSLIAKFAGRKIRRQKKSCTFKSRLVLDSQLWSIEIFDDANRSLSEKEFYESSGFIFVYSVTDAASFEYVRKAYTAFSKRTGISNLHHTYSSASSSSSSNNSNSNKSKDYNHQHPLSVVLVGCKSDSEGQRCVSSAEGERLAREWGVPFYETYFNSETNSIINTYFHSGISDDVGISRSTRRPSVTMSMITELSITPIDALLRNMVEKQQQLYHPADQENNNNNNNISNPSPMGSPVIGSSAVSSPIGIPVVAGGDPSTSRVSSIGSIGSIGSVSGLYALQNSLDGPSSSPNSSSGSGSGSGSPGFSSMRQPRSSIDMPPGSPLATAPKRKHYWMF